MNTAVNINENEIADVISRQSSTAKDPNVFTDIYREDTNIVIWQRQNSSELTTAVNHFLKYHSKKTAILAVTAASTHKVLCETFGESNIMKALSDDITLLVDMFCCLFDLECAGLRLTVLDRAMCPRFHIDRIPCRLVTTYQGIATEWLNHDVIDRSKLGAGNEGKSDEESGLFKSLQDIQRLSEGDVALLKGENWDETQGAGLVHRSPAMSTDEHRLLLTLDFISD